MKIDQRFKKGLELFNKGEYFECHEVIEDLWLETDPKDPYRDLYKGVIQAAAAIYQLDRGILSGARGLFSTSVSYLKEYSPVVLGLNIEKLIKDLQTYFAAPGTEGGKEGPPGKRRFPQAEYDFKQ